MCCLEVSEIENSNLESRIIDGGKYAKFTIKGDMVESVGKAWQEIWEMDLDRKFSYDFEVYHNDSADMNNQTIDIYISIN
jgi:predicted transcriptional regulator YdeE